VDSCVNSEEDITPGINTSSENKAIRSTQVREILRGVNSCSSMSSDSESARMCELVDVESTQDERDELRLKLTKGSDALFWEKNEGRVGNRSVSEFAHKENNNEMKLKWDPTPKVILLR